MSHMKEEYLEKIYAGWLAKIIGIRLGAPIEGWTYEKIRNVYGELTGYPVDYRDFAADDDSNGPLFFLRALEDSKNGFDISSRDIADALLNYAPFERGFFWWGGYGVSTEHTAYLNLRNGIPAPESGSARHNGTVVSEQIGGQIFIDSWGLVCPGNPDLAAKYAAVAAGVTHDGNGIYGGIFIASCIAHAFDEKDIVSIIEKGLSYIPSDCEYTRVTREIMKFHADHPENWRDCFNFIHDNFGYDKYPGACHIIPNTAVIILALLYGNGDFSDTLNICNMCGWDTDCNVGNIATIMGVRGGLAAIDYDKWRHPINDFLACSGVVGSLNIMDIPYGASYIAKLAWALADEALPGQWKEILEQRIDSCHFEYPGSTHAIRVRTEPGEPTVEVFIENTAEAANTGSRSLKVVAKPLAAASRIFVYKKTYYRPEDFHDSRYDPSFSPLLYPGQTIHGSAMIPDYGCEYVVRLYARDTESGEIIESSGVIPEKGKWVNLTLDIPSIDCGLIDEAGFAFDIIPSPARRVSELTVFIDDLYFDGKPSYSLDASKLREEIWTNSHREIIQFTKLKGLFFLEDGLLHLSCADFAEAYTGRHDWTDYTAEFVVKPVTGNCHMVNVRVQGAIRSYAAALVSSDKICLFKNDNGYRKLTEADFIRESGREYTLKVSVKGNEIVVFVDGKEYLRYTDTDNPYISGGIGISVRDGSHCAYRSIAVNR